MVSLPAPVLPDVLEPGLRVVFCGTAPGTASARAGAYYAGPGNRFWVTLHEVGLTPVLLRPAPPPPTAGRAPPFGVPPRGAPPPPAPPPPAGSPRLPEFGIGLTDVSK